MPRQADPELEKRILVAASRLWARGGEKALTMRAVAKAAGTTTPTVYERYRDRDDIRRALRLKTRQELFASLLPTRDLSEAIQNYLNFALANTHGYQVLFDGVGKPPSLYEPWPSFNLMRDRLTRELGGNPRQHNRLMLGIWSLMHGTAMLIIRGNFEGALRIQAIHACLDSVKAVVKAAKRKNGLVQSSPKWPDSLVLGEAEQSRVEENGDNGQRQKSRRQKRRR